MSAYACGCDLHGPKTRGAYDAETPPSARSRLAGQWESASDITGVLGRYRVDGAPPGRAHAFLDLFVTETLVAGEGLAVKRLALLFTDLQGSTAL